MEDEVKVIARMDRKKKIRLFHVLLDEQISFSAWLRQQIDAYLAEKEPKDTRARVLGDRRREKRWTDIQKATGKPKPKGRKRKEG